MRIPVEITFALDGKDYGLEEFKQFVRELRAENVRLREVLDKAWDALAAADYASLAKVINDVRYTYE